MRTLLYIHFRAVSYLFTVLTSQKHITCRKVLAKVRFIFVYDSVLLLRAGSNYVYMLVLRLALNGASPMLHCTYSSLRVYSAYYIVLCPVDILIQICSANEMYASRSLFGCSYVKMFSFPILSLFFFFCYTPFSLSKSWPVSSEEGRFRHSL